MTWHQTPALTKLTLQPNRLTQGALLRSLTKLRYLQRQVWSAEYLVCRFHSRLREQACNRLKASNLWQRTRSHALADHPLSHLHARLRTIGSCAPTKAGTTITKIKNCTKTCLERHSQQKANYRLRKTWRAHFRNQHSLKKKKHRISWVECCQHFPSMTTPLAMCREWTS